MSLEQKIIAAVKELGPLRLTDLSKILKQRRAEIAAACIRLVLTEELELTSDMRVDMFKS